MVPNQTIDIPMASDSAYFSWLPGTAGYLPLWLLFVSLPPNNLFM